MIDIVRQAVAEKGRLVYPIMIDAYKAGEKELFAASSQRFLDLILLQDKLLAARPEFKVGTWIEKARNLGTTPEEKDLYEWNARVQVTTWEIVWQLMKADYATMHTKNGTVCCVISIITVGRCGLTGKGTAEWCAGEGNRFLCH